MNKAAGGLLTGSGPESSGFRLADFHPGSTLSSLVALRSCFPAVGLSFLICDMEVMIDSVSLS